MTLVHFGATFDKKIKPWVLPDVENRMREGVIAARWDSRVAAIEPGAVTVAATMTDPGAAIRFSLWTMWRQRATVPAMSEGCLCGP